MKVLVISQYFHPEDFKINDAVEYLVNSGNEVRVLTAFPNYPGGTIFKGYSLFKNYPKSYKGAYIYRTIIFPRKRGPVALILNYLTFAVFSRIRAVSISNDFNPDIILGFQLSPIWSMLPAKFLKKRLEIPFVLWCLDLWPESFLSNFVLRNSLLDAWVERSSERIYQSADALAVTTRSFKNHLSKVTGKPESAINHLPNWAEDSYLNFLESEFSFNSDYCNLVFAGNVGESQGLDVLLRAARETVDSNIRWHIFGDGRNADKLHKQVERLQISNFVLHGRVSVEMLPSIYRSSDALLLTLKPNQGYSGTIPGKFAGYLTSGKPIITNIEGEVTDIVKGNGLGFIFNGNDENDLIKAVYRLKMSTKMELDQIQLNCKRFYDNNYSKKKVLTTLENILTKTIS